MHLFYHSLWGQSPSCRKERPTSFEAGLLFVPPTMQVMDATSPLGNSHDKEEVWRVIRLVLPVLAAGGWWALRGGRVATAKLAMPRHVGEGKCVPFLP